MLELKDIIIASIDAQTENAPLIPQNQGVRYGNFFNAKSIPEGNAMPIKKPIGESTNIVFSIFILIDNSAELLKHCDENIPYTTSKKIKINK